MTDSDLYRDHLQQLDAWLADALERARAAGRSFDGVVFHAGRLEYYHADDQPIPFRTTPHFARWTPLAGPEHLLLARPGARPRVVRVQPRDYWYDTSPAPESYWERHVELEQVGSFGEAVEALGPVSGCAFVGASREAAASLHLDSDAVEPGPLMAPLDWWRAIKTPWEVSRMREACRRAAAGHAAGRDAFLAGASERDVLRAYLAAADHLEAELPYESIVAFDEKAAILHYQHKRGRERAPGRVLLLDAGAAFEGYASDITRTWCAEGVDDVFRTLVDALDALERDLVAMVTPGRPYPEIHLEAHRRIGALLAETGIVKVSAGEAVDTGLTRAFLPHGVGHPLGIQVHDVGGHQAAPEGGTTPPPKDHPYLRTTRTLEPGHVVTIEPGIYFIPMLLEPLREGASASAIDWALVDRLTPLGGIRIEDDVLCTADGPDDLTRALIPGSRGT